MFFLLKRKRRKKKQKKKKKRDEEAEEEDAEESKKGREKRREEKRREKGAMASAAAAAAASATVEAPAAADKPSLGRSVESPLAPGLSGVWLSRFHSLSLLSVQDVDVDASSLSFIISDMADLRDIAFANTKLCRSQETSFMDRFILP